MMQKIIQPGRKKQQGWYEDLPRGTSFTIPVEVRSEDDTPVDLTNCSIVFTIKDVQSDSDHFDKRAYVIKNFEPQIPAQGQFFINLTPRDLDFLPGEYYFDIEIYDNGKSFLWRLCTLQFKLVGGPSNRMVHEIGQDDFFNPSGCTITAIKVPQGPPVICFTAPLSIDPAIHTEIQTLQTTVDTFADTVDNHTSYIGALQTDLTDLASTVDDQEDSLSVLNESVQQLSADKADQSTVDSLDAQVSANKDNIDILFDHKTNTNNPHSVTAAQLGLGNVENTTDAEKPISDATQAALDLKADVSALENYAPKTHNHDDVYATLSDLADIELDVAAKADASELADKMNIEPEAIENDIAVFDSAGQVVDGGKTIAEVLAEAGGGTPSDTNPVMNGTATPGISDEYSRGDHVHPTDTSRVSVDNLYIITQEIKNYNIEDDDPDYGEIIQNTSEVYTTYLDSDMTDDVLNIEWSTIGRDGTGAGMADIQITKADTVVNIVVAPTRAVDPPRHTIIYSKYVPVYVSWQGEHVALYDYTTREEIESTRLIYLQPGKYLLILHENAEFYLASSQGVSPIVNKRIVLSDKSNDGLTPHTLTLPQLETNETLGTAAFEDKLNFATARHTHDWVEIVKTNNIVDDTDIPISGGKDLNQYSEFLFVYYSSETIEIIQTRTLPRAFFTDGYKVVFNSADGQHTAYIKKSSDNYTVKALTDNKRWQIKMYGR